MKVYDNYEISPCRRYEEPDSPGKFYFEACEPQEADVWTLYGHISGEGVEAIGDFPSREAAMQVYSRITGQPFTGSYQADAHLRVMHAGPKLLDALRELLADVSDLASDYEICHEIIHSSYGKAAHTAIADAAGDFPLRSPRPIVIEVRGGIVQDVLNVPPGYQYEVKDYDTPGTEQEDGDAPRSTLPPDPEGMNDKRAGWAGGAVRAFQGATGTDDEDALGDLLADLMHWADRNNYDFDAALIRGRGHYEAETAGEVT